MFTANTNLYLYTPGGNREATLLCEPYSQVRHKKVANRTGTEKRESEKNFGTRRAVGTWRASDGQSALGGRPAGSRHSAGTRPVILVLHYITNCFENYYLPCNCFPTQGQLFGPLHVRKTVQNVQTQDTRLLRVLFLTFV